MKIDINDSFAVSISSQDTDGNDFDIAGYKITFVISDSDAGLKLASYDPTDNYSPSAAESRVIARLIMDALKKIIEG
jgi:hypothetical protein